MCSYAKQQPCNVLKSTFLLSLKLPLKPVRVLGGKEYRKEFNAQISQEEKC